MRFKEKVNSPVVLGRVVNGIKDFMEVNWSGCFKILCCWRCESGNREIFFFLDDRSQSTESDCGLCDGGEQRKTICKAMIVLVAWSPEIRWARLASTEDRSALANTKHEFRIHLSVYRGY